jgi:hypothetical protein
MAAPEAEFPWIETARVFLIDGYEPPFTPKLGFDARELAETMAPMHANTLRITTMGRYALIHGVRFTPDQQLGQRGMQTTRHSRRSICVHWP